MSGVDFEYAIKKDVRNNPIVREVDAARQRQIWRSLWVGGLLVAVVLFSAWQNSELIQHGYNMQRLQAEHADQTEINRRLTLEVETLRSPERIERIARGMNLISPPPDRAIVIERVTPAAPPGKSIIASR
jgi:cell division protein FtsL